MSTPERYIQAGRKRLDQFFNLIGKDISLALNTPDTDHQEIFAAISMK